MSGKRWFWLAVAFQVLLLLGMAGVHQYTLSTGTPIVLKTAPVDPWDALRGQYVSLNYTITRLPSDQVPMTGLPYKTGQTVWVTVRRGTPDWTATAVSTTRPALAGADQIALRGRVDYAFQQKPGSTSPEVYEVRIHYGIEQFYVPEGAGQALEQAGSRLTVEVAVDRFGQSALRQVFLDDKPIQFH